MKAYLYCDQRSLNEATLYYVNLIKRCICIKGYTYEIAHSLKEMHNPQLIVTITEKYFLKAKLKYPRASTIYWAQGVDAEEAKMTLSNLKSYIRYLFRRFAEPIAIRKATILFCVSERMKEYFKDMYGYKDLGNCIIMPCYNLRLSNHFELSQYEKPTFVYAGNSSAWQGVDLFLDVYSLVEKVIENARIVLLTGDRDLFRQKIKEKGIKNFEIKFVPLVDLQEELHKYKYGFILRDEHIVNQVATPTKMNSYLANFLIPIFSDSVYDFKNNVKLDEFTIMATCPLNPKTIAEKIISFENKVHDFSNYKAIVESVFSTHYNDLKYEDKILKMLDRKL